MRDINTDALAERYYASNDPQFQKEYEEWSDEFIEEQKKELQWQVKSELEDAEDSLDNALACLSNAYKHNEQLESLGDVSDYDTENILRILGRLEDYKQWLKR